MIIFTLLTYLLTPYVVETSDSLVEADGNFTLRVTSSCVEYRDDESLMVDAMMKSGSAYVILITDRQAQLTATTVRITLS